MEHFFRAVWLAWLAGLAGRAACAGWASCLTWLPDLWLARLPGRTDCAAGPPSLAGGLAGFTAWPELAGRSGWALERPG